MHLATLVLGSQVNPQLFLPRCPSTGYAIWQDQLPNWLYANRLGRFLPPMPLKHPTTSHPLAPFTSRNMQLECLAFRLPGQDTATSYISTC